MSRNTIARLGDSEAPDFATINNSSISAGLRFVKYQDDAAWDGAVPPALARNTMLGICSAVSRKGLAFSRAGLPHLGEAYPILFDRELNLKAVFINSQRLSEIKVMHRVQNPRLGTLTSKFTGPNLVGKQWD